MLKQTEGAYLEFKRAGDGAKGDVFESVCAMLNRFGGDLFLGVEDNGEIVGLPEGRVDEIAEGLSAGDDGGSAA